MRPLTVALLVSALLAGAGPRPSAATLFDPALRFRMLPTEHFIIYFHQGGERIARRMAAIAEETWRALEKPFGVVPRRTHVVLADQTDLANGYAAVLPYQTIVIYPVWPPGSDFDFDDWLRLSFTHEFTHIVQLDRSEGWARVVRRVLGRTGPAFPNLFLPLWQVEGLAVFEESAITGAGRLHAGEFRAIVGEAARAGRLEPLDRVNGGLTDWPGGAAVYAYGAGFHQYLADRYGAQKLADLAGVTARYLPYVASRAFRRVYGRPLGDLWREYEASAAAAVNRQAAGTSLQSAGVGPQSADVGRQPAEIGRQSVEQATPTPSAVQPPTRLTSHGFLVRGPRFDPFPCTGCAPEIIYSASNADGFPALYRVEADGGPPRRLATRYLGSTTGIGRDTLYFDQIEIRRNTGAYSDLYALSRAGGRVRALTHDARLLDPDLSPDGTTIVCTQDRTGRRDLVTIRLSAGGAATGTRDRRARLKPARDEVVTLLGADGVHFDAPKWSPDGRRIAVERHRAGAMPEIVVVDVATKEVRVVAADAKRRFVMPAWRRDGAALVAASAPEDEVFNLIELSLETGTGRQLTWTTGGATWPDVSPDGKTIAFVGYTADGFDVFTVPYPSVDRSAGTTTIAAATTATSAEATREMSEPAAVAYSPLRTLKPTSWFPVIEDDGTQGRLGASVGGVDVLGYHTWLASATWLVEAPSGSARPSAASPDWQVYYSYDRWRPRVFAAASNETAFFAGPPSDAGTPTASTRRRRQLEAGVVFPIRHVRTRHVGTLSILRSTDDFTFATESVSRNRTPMRASWQAFTSRTYGYSISREHGIAVGATAELVRRELGSFADATTLTGDLRAYLPGLAPHHVVALRLSGGASTGDATVGRTFLLGGDTPADSIASFDSGASSLLRGFGQNTFAGTHVALTNLEYRWPIARPQRGVGTWPLFLHSIHGALVADLGQAWTRTFQSRALKASAGAQVSADIVFGYFAPLTVTAGAAWGHDGSGLLSDRVTAYFRVGKAF